MLSTPTSSRVKRERAVSVFNDILHLAAKEGRLDQIQACLKSGADIDARDHVQYDIVEALLALRQTLSEAITVSPSPNTDTSRI